MAQAFTKRSIHSFGRSKYHNKPLTTCLAETLGKEAMFAGNRARGCSRKVAVTAATETGERAVIFANYNRKDDPEGKENKLHL
jgi:hypothetical protein